MTEKQFYVYTHSRPDGSIFYVGKGLKHRTQRKERKENPYHCRIVAKYGKENIIIKSMLCRDEQHAFDLEVKMIAALRNGGVKLANMTEGGEGSSGSKLSKEHIAKLVAANKGRVVTEEHKERMREARKHYVVTEETKRKMSESQKNRPPISEETRLKRSKSLKGRVVSIETRKKISETRKHKGIKHTQEIIQKISLANKGRVHTKEEKLKRSESVKKSWENRPRKHKKESILKMEASQKARHELKKQEKNNEQ